jgi:catechol 2,3-dioxygenase-like lactoylglutathione lyase family enzyme
MTSIRGIAEAVLYSADLDRAADFYARVLGLQLTASFAEARFLQTGFNSTLILFDAEGIARRHSVIPAHGARGPGHVALAVPGDELDAWRQRLEQHGVAIEHEQEWPQGTRSIYFRDPDGHSVELIDAEHYPLVWRRFQAETGSV